MAVATLIISPTAKPLLTSRREVDARTAIARSLADYLSTLRYFAPGGREVAFRRVFAAHAEQEVPAEFPSAALVVGSPRYDASSFTPVVRADQRLTLPDGRGLYLIKTCEMTADVVVDAWTTEPEERIQVMTMLEDALCPVDWMFGFRLAVPDYYGLHVEFEPQTMSYLDTEADAQHRYRRAQVSLAARVPVVRLSALPMAKPRAVVALDDVEVEAS